MKSLRFLLFGWLLAVSATVQAKLSIEITQGVEGALPIAVVPFGWEGKSDAPEDIGAIVGADLARSGRFAPRPVDDLPALPDEGRKVDFAQWRAAGSENLVVGRLQPDGDAYQVQFQLFDVLRGQQLAGYSIPSSARQLRRTAHQIADIIYEKLTGERGAFDTHIAYVTADQGDDGKSRYRLAVADADGFNEQVVLTSKEPLMSPAWSPDGTHLAYVSFESGRSAVYVQEIATGQRSRIADFPGINSAPAWSPDGKRLALTLSKDGDPEIYVVTLLGNHFKRITYSYSIDTEPSWSPDGQSIVFTSDRGGHPQLYRVDVDTQGARGRPKRLTFEGDYNARGAWSPDGRYLAMVNGQDGRFRIAVLDMQTGNLRVLTNSQLDESPSFAPNSSMLIYATETGGRGVLEAVSVDGRAHQRLGLRQGDVREPAWSPFISK